MTFLFLAHRMAMGFGVSVVIAELARRLAVLGHASHVGCIEHDDSWPDLDLHVVPGEPAAIAALAAKVGATIVVAQTTPYFEALPALPPPLIRVAWEHGDPTPSLFADDAAERAAIARFKRDHVYGAIDHVLASSHFLRHDIGWPQATVIHLGCDHITDCGPKPASAFAPGRPIRVGTLMRLGVGEAFYKGGDLFLAAMRAAKASGLDAQFAVMGRGTEADAESFRAEGVEVHLNATDDERLTFLRGLDVLITPSLWEGFNLPLVEAQALGTVGLAFDTGAHPEVTPQLASSPDDVLRQLSAYAADRRLLGEHSALAYGFVRQRFPWSRAAERLAALSLARVATAPAPLVPTGPTAWGKLVQSLQSDGLSTTAVRVARAVWRRAWTASPETGAMVAQSLRQDGILMTLRRILRRAWRWLDSAGRRSM